MQFLASLPTYGQDQAAKNIWNKLREFLGDTDGICYYKHPVITSTTKSVPDLTLLAHGFQPLVIKSLDFTTEDITSIEELTWIVRGQSFDSPVLELDDYMVGLQHKFDKERLLRHSFEIIGAVAFPLISKTEFEERFFPLPEHIKIIWADLNVEDALVPIASPIGDEEWLLAKSVFQGVSPLNKSVISSHAQANTFGEAIRILERSIALLDEEQHKVAVQIAPGPQRIRGLAGTGKTVVLAMKAANLHLRYPDKRILFTFHTQSLYNQARALITKFYRIHSDSDPDWDKLHVRHSWGGASRPGVYADVCKRYGYTPMTFTVAQNLDRAAPFRAACKTALQIEIKPYYEYILADEAQDFPLEFFRLLYRLATENKCIYWAYDELQSLSSAEVPSPTELFGVDQNGTALVSLEGEEYEGGIEKDFVLHRSYRCPQEVLMLAHAIGLGIHSIRGCVQMLANKSSWTSVGYEIVAGDLVKGEQTIIYRPPENSPNRIKQIYKGPQEIIEVRAFDERTDELTWVAESIYRNIAEEDVRPEQIVVISLDSKLAKRYLMKIQSELLKHDIGSTIPGLINDTAEFAEPGMVTLSTVYRAKGNEAPIVYIISFDSLYEYTEELERRNQAFAAISRSKGLVRITGTGKPMVAAKGEIGRILKDIPQFNFIFPDMEHLRRLDASETSRRRREVRTAKESISKLLGLELDALHALSPSLLKDLKNKLEEVSDED
jgi:superfamily I DNA and RNA helicase